MINYKLYPCVLCDRTMTLLDVQEGVYWCPDIQDQWDRFWNGPEHRFAHRKCWKHISEKRRRAIRAGSVKHMRPKTLGQFA